MRSNHGIFRGFVLYLSCRRFCARAMCFFVWFVQLIQASNSCPCIRAQMYSCFSMSHPCDAPEVYLAEVYLQTLSICSTAAPVGIYVRALLTLRAPVPFVLTVLSSLFLLRPPTGCLFTAGRIVPKLGFDRPAQAAFTSSVHVRCLPTPP